MTKDGWTMGELTHLQDWIEDDAQPSEASDWVRRVTDASSDFESVDHLKNLKKPGPPRP